MNIKRIYKKKSIFLLILHIHRIIYKHGLRLIHLQKIHKMNNKVKLKLMKIKVNITKIILFIKLIFFEFNGNSIDFFIYLINYINNYNLLK